VPRPLLTRFVSTLSFKITHFARRFLIPEQLYLDGSKLEAEKAGDEINNKGSRVICFFSVLNVVGLGMIEA